jgi:hypothetical protein
METNMQERVLVVRLHISRWCPWGYDQKKAAEVATQEGSKKEDTHVTKRKISKDALKDINDLLNQAYTYHISVTMPSGADGDRLITTDLYTEYCTKMNEFETKIPAALDKFLSEYPTWKEEARTRLQGLFKETDYPSVEEVKKKFSIRYSFLPLPSVNNIVVKLVNGDLANVRKNVEEEMSKMSEIAMKSLWDKTYDAVAHMAEILGSDARLHKSMLDNMNGLCNVLKSLNFTNNPELEEMRLKISVRLVGLDPNDLRKSRSVREEVAREAKSIALEISQKRMIRLE